MGKTPNTHVPLYIHTHLYASTHSHTDQSGIPRVRWEVRTCFVFKFYSLRSDFREGWTDRNQERLPLKSALNDGGLGGLSKERQEEKEGIPGEGCAEAGGKETSLQEGNTDPE